MLEDALCRYPVLYLDERFINIYHDCTPHSSGTRLPLLKVMLEAGCVRTMPSMADRLAPTTTF